MKKIVPVIVFVLAFLFITTQQSSPAASQSRQDEVQIVPANSESRIVTDSIYSDILGEKRAYTILLPRNYDINPGKKYPVLYLLHGIMDTNEGWYKNGRVKEITDRLTEKGEVCEMVIVMPSAGGDIYKGVWNGYFNMPGWRYEDFFFEEFMPHIETSYRIIREKERRAISGLSMGGGGCTVYAQRHPGMFCACYAMSALMNIPEGGGMPSKGQEKMDILNRSVREHSAVDFVKKADKETLDKLRSVNWFVDCGDDDILFDVNIEFYQAMRAARVPCQLRIYDGAHNWQYWHSALERALPFFSRLFLK